MKKHAPATLRNRDAIADVLTAELPASGTILEVASGTGEHAIYFAERFPDLIWQPTDCSEEALASIESYRLEKAAPNLLRPQMLDAALPEWPVAAPEAIICINMVHISPWSATIGLFEQAGQLLDADSPVILYGPFREQDVQTAPSNLNFDANLKARDTCWGLRDVADINRLAARHGFTRSARHSMPANNLTLVYRRNSE